MKTILTLFTAGKVNQTLAERGKLNAFVTSDDLVPGDLVKSSNYEAFIQVVHVIDDVYSYVNMRTGDLKNKMTSTNDVRIKELKLDTRERHVVYGEKL